jgi:predicted PurR-regulated permease PerM
MELLLVFVFLMSAVVAVIWWVVVIWIAKKAIQNSKKVLNQIFPQLELTLTNVIQGYRELNPEQKAQIIQMFRQANTHMRQLKDLSRQRYDTKMGELMSMAGSAGIDWTPPS